MNTYYQIQSAKFDHLSVTATLMRLGFIPCLNWGDKQKEVSKGKYIYPIIGIAVMDKAAYLRFCAEVPTVKRFTDSDKWFSNLKVGTEKELHDFINIHNLNKEDEHTTPSTSLFF